MPVLDPVTQQSVATIKHPYRDPKTPSSSTSRAGPSVYWGDEPIWDGHTSIHNPMMDEKGRVWFTARIRPAGESGLSARRARTFPRPRWRRRRHRQRQLSMYDPKTSKWSLIDTCFTHPASLFRP